MRRNLARLLVIALLLALPAGGASAQQALQTVDLEIFTTAEFPVPARQAPPGVTYRVYQLDALDHLEAELSKGLPATEVEAQAVAMQRIRAMGRELTERGNEGAWILERALRYGLEKYPAIVVNQGEALIYGVVDPAEAAALYQGSVAQ